MHQKRFVLCPGEVVSVNDGQRHYITAAQLAALAGVNPVECHIQNRRKYGPIGRGLGPGFSEEYLDSLVWITPRRDGNYRIKGGER